MLLLRNMHDLRINIFIPRNEETSFKLARYNIKKIPINKQNAFKILNATLPARMQKEMPVKETDDKTELLMYFYKIICNAITFILQTRSCIYLIK